MKTLVTTIFGSTLFGTATPESDMDYKKIIIPSGRDLLLGTYKEVLNTCTSAKGQKNTKEDVDTETFTLKHFINQALEGQTYALDMLFTPKNQILESSPEWDYIVANRNLLLHSNVSSFVNFAINQANKYKQKGERLKVLKQVNSFLETLSPSHKLQKYEKELKGFESISFLELPANNESSTLIPYIELFGKKTPLTSAVRVGLRTYRAMEKEYGDRARKAEAHGVDFKSKYHALRVAGEALELLNTESLTFPRPEADLLLKIRKGELKEAQVDKLIEDKLQEVKNAEKSTSLPPQGNRKFWEDFIVKTYAKEVKSL